MATNALTVDRDHKTMGNHTALLPMRAAPFSIGDFARGIALTAMENADQLGELIEKLTSAMRQEARNHAAATTPPRLPNWAVSTLVGLVVALVTMGATGLMTYGALVNRVANLESAHPEGMASLTTEVRNLGQRIEEMQRRMDSITEMRVKGR